MIGAFLHLENQMQRISANFESELCSPEILPTFPIAKTKKLKLVKLARLKAIDFWKSLGPSVIPQVERSDEYNILFGEINSLFSTREPIQFEIIPESSRKMQFAILMQCYVVILLQIYNKPTEVKSILLLYRCCA